MTSTVNAIIANADYFVLLLLRVGGLIISSPVFGRINIPNTVKIGFTAALTYFFFTLFPQSAAIEYSSLIGFLLICAGELLLGIALAYITNMFFTLTYVTGHMVDMQIGFSMVNVYDIQNRTQAPVTGNILNIALIIIFFTVDGHLELIKIIYLTIDSLPVGGLAFSPNIGLAALQVFARAFLLGIMVAMPVIASGLVLEIVMGMLMRAVPQIHMFVVGVPLKLVIGLIVFTAALPVFISFSSRIFSEMFLGVETMFGAFTAAVP